MGIDESKRPIWTRIADVAHDLIVGIAINNQARFAVLVLFLAVIIGLLVL